jgi:four helix bundle protein
MISGHSLDKITLYKGVTSSTLWRMKASTSFRDLLVWQKAHALVLGLYRLTRTFPRHEEFCLIPQMRRAAISVPANIVEGFRRRGKSDKVRFFNTAQASLEETRYYLILCQDLNYAETGGFEQSADEVSKLLNAYAKATECSKFPRS